MPIIYFSLGNVSVLGIIIYNFYRHLAEMRAFNLTKDCNFAEPFKKHFPIVRAPAGFHSSPPRPEKLISGLARDM